MPKPARNGLKGVAVGDTLVIRGHRSLYEAKVEKIGRTLIHARWGNHDWQTGKYYIEDGSESRPANAIGTGEHARTLKQEQMQREYEVISDEFTSLRIRFGLGNSMDKFSNEALRKVIDILREDLDGSD